MSSETTLPVPCGCGDPQDLTPPNPLMLRQNLLEGASPSGAMGEILIGKLVPALSRRRLPKGKQQRSNESGIEGELPLSLWRRGKRL